MTHILEAVAQKIDLAVDKEEAVMYLVGQLDGLDGRLLAIFDAQEAVVNVLLKGYKLAVDGVALEEIVTQDAGCPDAELRTPLALDAIAHGDDDIEVVICYPSLYGSVTFFLNCQGFLDCWTRGELSFFEYVVDVEADILLCGLKEFDHLCLCEPNGFLLELDLKRYVIIGLVEDYLAFLGWDYVITFVGHGDFFYCSVRMYRTSMRGHTPVRTLTIIFD